MTRTRAPLVALLRDVTRLDLPQVSFIVAARDTLAVVAPLGIGAATGHLVGGLMVAIGALTVSFSDRPAPYRLKADRMLLGSAVGAVSVFVGSASGGIGWLAVLLAAAWGFGGGLLVALGQDATQIGLSGIILLVVLAHQPGSPLAAARLAGLVLLGGLLPTLLAIAPWPWRRFGPERAALAAVFRALADFARAPTAPTAPPPASGALLAASTALAGIGVTQDQVAEGLRSLLDEAERTRGDLLALSDLRARVPAAVSAAIAAFLAAAAPALAAIARGIASGRLPPASAAAVVDVERATEALRGVTPEAATARPADRLTAAEAAGRAEALSGQLRAAARIVEDVSQQAEPPAVEPAPALPRELQPRAPLAILRANLTLRSAAFRHAIRLAAGVALADALARLLGLPRGYWVPLTVAIVLKPEFATTFARGLARLVGTGLGLVLATVLVHTLLGGVGERIALVAVLVFVIRGLGPANYAILVVAVTAMIVVLLSLAGVPPGTTIADRGLDTVLGGALALIAFVVWPTWERTTAPDVLADLLAADRAYFGAVMQAHLQPAPPNPATVRPWRNAARLARSNAEASVERLSREPGRSPGELDLARGLLANSHRFVRGALALEALLGAGGVRGSPTLDAFVADVEVALDWLARALRGGTPSRPPPDLRAAARALEHAPPELLTGAQPAAALARQVLLAREADRIVDSINTMIHLLRAAKLG